MSNRLFVADLIKRVRSIRGEPVSNKEKLEKLDAIARGIDWEYTACMSKLEQAEQLGRGKRTRALQKYKEVLKRSMQFVTTTAKRIAGKNAGHVGFNYEPSYLAHPRWDKQGEPPSNAGGVDSA
ncbi:MAG: hypothetical protein KF784_04145 [Fimbriimonadaceae bacterium]|nr:hypothetical protein [Fimbriimonadaceae bacterium]